MTSSTMRIFQHPNGYWYAELERNRRRSLGTRDKAEAQKLYRRLKAEFLLNRVAFLNDGRTVEFTREAILREEFQSQIEHNQCNPVLMSRVGKKAAGRLLDGCTWDEAPMLENKP